MIRILFLICLITSCDETAQTPQSLPSCIEVILDNQSEEEAEIQKINVQRLDNELHYWLETGARSYDGLEFVLVSNCDTLCQIGGLRPMECARAYTSEWETVWSKK